MNTPMSRLMPIAMMIGLLIVALNSGSGYAAMQPQCPTLAEQVSDNIRYMSAGQGEREKLANMTKGYNLELVFARRNGDYVSNVQVTIRGIHYNQYLKTESCGPWFTAKLPEGRYRVTASYDGHTQFREVTVGEMRNTLMFNWS